MSSYSAQDLLQLLQAEIATLLTYTSVMAQDYHLNISEIAALEHLQQSSELTPGQLGKRLSMTSGAITALLDRLERAGYIKRHPHPRDRRSWIVRPTAEGTERILRGRLGLLGKELLAINENLTEEERAAIGQYLTSVTAALSQYTYYPSTEKE